MPVSIENRMFVAGDVTVVIDVLLFEGRDNNLKYVLSMSYWRLTSPPKAHEPHCSPHPSISVLLIHV